MIYVDSSVVVALLVNEPHSAAVARRYARTKLKPSFKVISLRVPINLLDAPRIEANRRDVPYQSLIKVWLSGKVAKQSPALLAGRSYAWLTATPLQPVSARSNRYTTIFWMTIADGGSRERSV